MRSKRTLTLAIALAAALLIAACGGGGGDTPSASGGWIGGEPTWRESSGDGGGGDMAVPTEDGVAYDRAAGSAGAPEPGNGPLRAGSVDDNADFPGFLAYLERLAAAGVVTRDFDPRGRIVATVTGSNGLPVAGAEVVVIAAGDEIARLRTTADGTVRFLPALYGAGDATSFDLAVAGATVTTEPGTEVAVEVDQAGGTEGAVAVDILFLLDATGSMGDEIDRLKTTIDSVADRISRLESAPDVRFAMTLYRDQGDTFVTSTYDFTGDVAEFRKALADVQADGGGDYPEALDEGLAAALGEPSWRDAASTVQLVFLVADAPPQVDRNVQKPYTESIRDAVARGVKVFPVASSESDDVAEAVFRQLAQATGAPFVFLSYGAGGAATGDNTDIDSTDYEELSLDDLVVRLVTEELDALTGETTPPPSTSTTSTTNPQGQ